MLSTALLSTIVPTVMAQANTVHAATITSVENSNKATFDNVANTNANVDTDNNASTRVSIDRVPTVSIKHVSTDHDTSRQFVRKIYVKLPGQDKQLVSTDTLKFSRGYTTDEVTGQVTYEKWNTQDTNDFQAPTFAGYTPDKTVIQGKTIDPNQSGYSNEEDDTITYTANQQQMHINFVDANGKKLSSQTVEGVTGQTVDISKDSLKIPANYRIADGATYPAKVTFGSTPVKDYTIQVVPDTTPAGTETKDIKRTINLHYPNGQTETVVQTARFTRTKRVNRVTGQTEYGDWSDGTEFPEYDLPSVAGLTPDKANVSSQAVKATDSDSTVDVNYTANKQNVKINFVDKQGKTVGSQTVDGVTGKSVKVDLQVPQGYQIQGGQQIPNMITFGAKPLDDLTVKVETDSEAQADTHVKTDAEKYVPAARNFNLQLGDTLPDAKNAITNLDQLPEGTKVDWTSKPDMEKPGDYVVHVAVTYPDASLTSVDVPIKLSAPKKTDDTGNTDNKDNQGNKDNTVDDTNKDNQGKGTDNNKSDNTDNKGTADDDNDGDDSTNDDADKSADNEDTNKGNKDNVNNDQNGTNKDNDANKDNKDNQDGKDSTNSNSTTDNKNDQNSSNVNGSGDENKSNVNDDSNSQNGTQNVDTNKDQTNTNTSSTKGNSDGITIGSDSKGNNEEIGSTGNDAEIDTKSYPKQNLPETAENKDGLAAAGIGVASLASLVGLAGVELKKRRN